MPIFALISLTVAAFAVATSELMLVGLLPQIARSLDVSISQAGLLVTGYALGVVVAAPIVAVITNGMARKRTLLGLMVIFTVGNIVCALAPGYYVLLGSRILTAISHAALFGTASVIAAEIVPSGRRASAVAIVFSGATIATILGVPIGTAAGQEFGWQSAFWMVAGMGVMAIVAIAAWLPDSIPSQRANFRQELKILRQVQVVLALVVSAFVWASLFAVFTYIAPILEEVAGAPEHAVVWVLLVFGIGMTIGNFIGGRLADWHLLPSIVALIAAAAVSLFVFAVVIQDIYLVVGSLLAWGMFVFALAPALQYWVVKAASGARALVSTINQASFHLGGAAGAWIGASALYFGVTYSEIPWIGELLGLAALAVAILAISAEHRRRRKAFAEPGDDT